LTALVDLGVLSTLPFKFSAVFLPVFNVSTAFTASFGAASAAFSLAACFA
jgi:hypothetical protein